MRHGEAGFTLVEVVVAFAIVSLVLGGLYQAMAGAWHGVARTQVREQALALARAHLEAIGVEQPATPGMTAGTYATAGIAWRLAVEPIETRGYKGRAVRIVLETLDQAGNPLVRLETFKLGPRPN